MAAQGASDEEQSRMGKLGDETKKEKQQVADAMKPKFVAMDPWKRDALLRHEGYLTANLNLDSLLSRLDNGGFMTVEEKTSVEAEEGQNKQVIKMVAILRQKGNEEFVTFLNLLKETGNVLVASELEKSAQQYKLEYPRHDQYVQILTNHGEEFLEKMNSKAIAKRLRALDLIPEDVDYEIKHAATKDTYNATLLNHLKREATRKQVLDIFKVASEQRSYGNMKEFAVRIVLKMQQDEFVSSVPESEDYAHVALHLNNSSQLKIGACICVTLCIAAAWIGITVYSANPEYIPLGIFAVGQCIEAYYTAPTTGRATIDLSAADGMIVLTVDYRKHWGGNPDTGQPWQNILILNSKIGGAWGTEQHVKDIVTTPGMEMALIICAEKEDFSIVLNQKKVATYTYRKPGTTVTKVEFSKYGFDSILRKFCVVQSQPGQPENRMCYSQ